MPLQTPPCQPRPVTRRNEDSPQAGGNSTGALPDIADEQDVADLIRDFYGRAFADPLLGPVFVDVARMDLDAHMPVMRDFWMTVLFRDGRYRRNALTPHVALHSKTELTSAHFERWVALWTAAVASRHDGAVARRAVVQAERIAVSLERRLSAGADLQPLRTEGARSGEALPLIASAVLPAHPGPRSL